MDLATARTRFAELTATVDTVEPPLADADRDVLINEAYLDYVGRFGTVLEYSGDVPISANPFTLNTAIRFPAASGRMTIRLEGMERKLGSVYIPLTRLEERQIGLLRATEDATGDAQSFGTALSSRSLAPTLAAVYRVRTYPRHSGSQNFRFLASMWPLELAAAGDALVVDDASADVVCLMAAWRAGDVLGYPDSWMEALMLQIPERQRNALAIAYGTKWQVSPGLERQPTLLTEAGGGRGV